jgi:hypothetical protein
MDDIRHLLPAYAAGSLDRDSHARVEQALQGSPILMAEALELLLVNDHLLALRAELDEQARTVDA